MSVFDQSRNMLHSAGITCQTHWSTARDPKEISQVLSLTYMSIHTSISRESRCGVGQGGPVGDEAEHRSLIVRR